MASYNSTTSSSSFTHFTQSHHNPISNLSSTKANTALNPTNPSAAASRSVPPQSNTKAQSAQSQSGAINTTRAATTRVEVDGLGFQSYEDGWDRWDGPLWPHRGREGGLPDESVEQDEEVEFYTRMFYGRNKNYPRTENEKVVNERSDDWRELIYGE
ncbi:hypothetical protein GQ43DRAFT_87945 [Delitschia confertaspora ATCC 74209]|uniref:Uncharacterized protein n=1 Tax=Delitschia confertaspora ATCC 74209 TaxID=1513339 RepID=A0A9P4JIN5_9PLEO|nr:hypothetical protein GQ43DRAFT_87945 [Delitschia confertaspora ATCC 74209]